MKPRMKSLQANCADLARLLSSEDFFNNQIENVSEWARVTDWLLVAGGIKNVELDREVLNEAGYQYCRPVFEFEEAQNEVQAAMVKQLTIFSFLWGSLESTINIISPQQAPGRSGKINSACYYIMQNLPATLIFQLYPDFLRHLEKLIRTVHEYDDLVEHFNSQAHVDERGQGIYVIYKIRNRFAHGSLILPSAGGDIKNNPDKMIIHTSSHIVVITIQMLISAFLQNSTFDVTFGTEEDEDVEALDIHYLLRTLHFEA